MDPEHIRIPGFVQVQRVRGSGRVRYAARLGSTSARVRNVGTFGTRRQAEEALAIAKARISADLVRRLRARALNENGWRSAGRIIDDERRTQDVAGYERRVESRRT